MRQTLARGCSGSWTCWLQTGSPATKASPSAARSNSTRSGEEGVRVDELGDGGEEAALLWGEEGHMHILVGQARSLRRPPGPPTRASPSFSYPAVAAGVDRHTVQNPRSPLKTNRPVLMLCVPADTRMLLSDMERKTDYSAFSAVQHTNPPFPFHNRPRNPPPLPARMHRHATRCNIICLIAMTLHRASGPAPRCPPNPRFSPPTYRHCNHMQRDLPYRDDVAPPPDRRSPGGQPPASPATEPEEGSSRHSPIITRTSLGLDSSTWALIVHTGRAGGGAGSLRICQNYNTNPI